MKNDVVFTAHGLKITEQESKNYIDYVRENISNPGELTEVKVVMCDDGKVDVNYKTQGAKFERIRRITGYLVGDLNRWNNSKRSEEKERIKHGVDDY